MEASFLSPPGLMDGVGSKLESIQSFEKTGSDYCSQGKRPGSKENEAEGSDLQSLAFVIRPLEHLPIIEDGGLKIDLIKHRSYPGQRSTTKRANFSRK